MDAPVRAPTDGGGLLERLLDEAERGIIPPPAASPPTTAPAPSVIPSLPPASDMPIRPSTPPPVSSPSSGGFDLGGAGGLLGSLLGNPALLGALPSLLENLGPLMGSLRPSGDASSTVHPPSGGHTSPASAAPPTERAAAADSSILDPPPARRLHVPPDRHTALLCAVKPYLGPERQAAADTVLRLCRVWDALAKSGLTLGSLGAILRPLGDAVASATISGTAAGTAAGTAPTPTQATNPSADTSAGEVT